MQDYVYEYAVIRVVPRQEREEFLNAGVILFCKRKKFLRAICRPDAKRFLAAFPELDWPVVAKNLDSLVHIAEGRKGCGPISQLEPDERFRWLTAIRSTVVQCSRPHPGLTEDPEKCLEKLFEELI